MPKFVKGSPEAKAFMAKLRQARTGKSKGGNITNFNPTPSSSVVAVQDSAPPQPPKVKGSGVRRKKENQQEIEGGDIWGDIGRSFNPKRNGFNNAMSSVGNALEKVQDPLVNGLKTVAKASIPAITGAVGGLAGNMLSPIGGVAGSAAGSYAGSQINNAIGLGIVHHHHYHHYY